MNYFHLQVSKPLTVADEEKLKANFKIPTQIGPEDVKTQDSLMRSHFGTHECL